MGAFGAIVTAILFAALAVGLTLDAKRGPLPIGFKSMRECAEVGFTAHWACRHVDRQDPRYKTLLSLYFRLGQYPMYFYFLRAMRRQELEIVAPFIDKIIEGKGPPLNLPAEYEDERPAILAKFKARMQDEGLWPLPAPPSGG